jgi:hypothetical protein
MPTFARHVAAAFVAATLLLAGGCGEQCCNDALVARSPDGTRIAVATVGARNVRVLYVNAPSIVRLHEAFVPEGAPIGGIAWSDDGRELIVRTSGPAFAIDTRTWRVAATPPPVFAERR